MFAKVTKAFAGRLDGDVKPRQVEVGEVISGELAAVAVRQGWAAEVPPNANTETPVAPSAKPKPPHGMSRAKGA